MDINLRDRPHTERTPPPVVLKQLSGAERVIGGRPFPEVDLCPAPIPGETQTAITSLSKPLKDGGGDSTPGLKGLPGAIAIVAADVCNDAGGVRWCRRCRSASGAWHASCPRCGGVLVAVPRPGRRVKTEAA